MRIQTPYKFHKIGYIGLDTSARAGDELLAIGVGRLYFGIYPTSQGVELSYGILNQFGCLE